MIVIFCDNCKKESSIGELEFRTDKYNKLPWTDIICGHCSTVIVTLTGNESGVFNIVKTKD